MTILFVILLCVLLLFVLPNQEISTTFAQQPWDPLPTPTEYAPPPTFTCSINGKPISCGYINGGMPCSIWKEYGCAQQISVTCTYELYPLMNGPLTKIGLADIQTDIICRNTFRNLYGREPSVVLQEWTNSAVGFNVNQCRNGCPSQYTRTVSWGCRKTDPITLQQFYSYDCSELDETGCDTRLSVLPKDFVCLNQYQQPVGDFKCPSQLPAFNIPLPAECGLIRTCYDTISEGQFNSPNECTDCQSFLTSANYPNLLIQQPGFCSAPGQTTFDIHHRCIHQQWLNTPEWNTHHVVTQLCDLPYSPPKITCQCPQYGLKCRDQQNNIIPCDCTLSTPSSCSPVHREFDVICMDLTHNIEVPSIHCEGMQMPTATTSTGGIPSSTTWSSTNSPTLTCPVICEHSLKCLDANNNPKDCDTTTCVELFDNTPGVTSTCYPNQSFNVVCWNDDLGVIATDPTSCHNFALPQGVVNIAPHEQNSQFWREGAQKVCTSGNNCQYKFACGYSGSPGEWWLELDRPRPCVEHPGAIPTSMLADKCDSFEANTKRLAQSLSYSSNIQIEFDNNAQFQTGVQYCHATHTAFALQNLCYDAISNRLVGNAKCEEAYPQYTFAETLNQQLPILACPCPHVTHSLFCSSGQALFQCRNQCSTMVSDIELALGTSCTHDIRVICWDQLPTYGGPSSASFACNGLQYTDPTTNTIKTWTFDDTAYWRDQEGFVCPGTC